MDTDLSSLIGSSDCRYSWNFRNFPATLILREINFADFQRVFLTISEVLNFDSLGIAHLKMSKIPKNSKFGVAQMIKMAVYRAWASK